MTSADAGIEASGTRGRRSTRSGLIADLASVLILPAVYLAGARGSIAANDGDVPYQIDLLPSPLIAALLVALLVLAAVARRSSTPWRIGAIAATVAAIAAVIVAMVATMLWIQDFDPARWSIADGIEAPWWGTVRVSIGEQGS